MIDLVLEESLDQLDPLRHLRSPDDADDPAADISDIVPAQRPSVLDQTIELEYPTVPDAPPVRIKLAVDASPGCGGIAWPAGEVLSRYIARRGPDALRGKTVLELGSGTGLVGLVAGKLGAEVWITDQAPLLPIMQRNVAMNALVSSVHVVELNWGEPILPTVPHAPDLILAADCVYFEPAFPLLVQTLAALVPPAATSTKKLETRTETKVDTGTEVLFCYKKRRKADKRFFALLKKEFAWSEVTDDPAREVYAREAISLLRLVRRR